MSHPSPPGCLDLATLRRLVEAGTIDTVLTVAPDMQGRLVGKRVTGHHFIDEVAPHGVHACSYLLGCDIDMDTQPGYALTGWETGYHDVLFAPDLATLRVVPWLPNTALVVCDVLDEDGAPVEEAPRTILRRQLERARSAGYDVMTASELEFYLFEDSYSDAARKHHEDLRVAGDYIQDYHVLRTTRDEWLLRKIRNGMDAAGIPVEASKGEWAPGQHEVNLRYAEALEMADRHAIYKNGVKEMAAEHGVAITFMAKWNSSLAGSSFHLHSSLWRTGTERAEALFHDAGGGPDAMSETFRRWLAGQLACTAELAYFYAPTVNSYKRFQAGTFAPTLLVWGRDNRTCGLRVIGRGPGLRVENRVPGADANPYLAFAATIAAGLHGVREGLALPEPAAGNAYECADAPRVPANLREAIARLERSEIARAAFGDRVIDHYLNSARLEQSVFDRAVTGWERERYFERI